MDSNFIKSYPNFLPQSTFNRLQKYVLGANFPWWYTITDHNPDDFSMDSLSKIEQPPKEILDLVEFERPPSVQYDDDKNYMVFLYRDNYKSISDLSEKELRLGGLRINPKTNIGSRATFYNNVKIKKLKDKNGLVEQASGLPDNPKLTNFTWSPDETKIALTNTTNKGVELWVLDLETASAVKLTDAILNANIGGVITWQADSQSMLVKILSKNKKP